MKEKKMHSLQEIPLSGKRVLMRVDFNVPLNEKGEIADDSRIQATLPSIYYILEQGASLILMSHFGRPKGKTLPQYSLAPCAERLSEILGKRVLFLQQAIEERERTWCTEMQSGEIALLENLRFEKGEENPALDPSLASFLASLGEVYVNDAFGACHRSHSSIVPITTHFQEQCATGFLLEKELSYLEKILHQPDRPFYAIVGGKKISSKLGVLHRLIEKVDGILIGGGMAFTFLAAEGVQLGKSIVERESISTTREIIDRCQERNIPLLLPEDIVASSQFNNEGEVIIVDVRNREEIPENFLGMDVGPKTVEAFRKQIERAKTVLWNGTLGVAEFSRYAKGTDRIAEILGHSSATTIVAGGDSIAAVNHAQLSGQIDHLSTGGGATLEYIEKGSLPGVDALLW